MEIRTLGCSGGIGGGLRTTSFLVDHRVLIDAGTGVGDLSLAELALIDHLFLTHVHLDHIAMLPLMLDSVGAMRSKPLVVHAEQESIDILRRHIFNWLIWPDFSEIPNKKHPFLIFEPLTLGKKHVLGGGLEITALPARHTVPAVGYHVRGPHGSWAFSGDTGGQCPEFWQAINAIEDLRYLVIETAFCNRERPLAELSRHLCPDMLAEELGALRRPAEIYITHLKPGELELTMREVEHVATEWLPRMLQNDHSFSV